LAIGNGIYSSSSSLKRYVLQ